MNVSLKQGVRHIAEADSLSREQLTTLRELLKHSGDCAPATGTPRRRPVRWAAVVGSIVIGLIAGIWLAQPEGMPNRAAELADEIAKNHIAAKPLDVRGATLRALREPFAALGFALQDLPGRRPPGRLEGGRYCSVQTVPAALLRYRTGADSDSHVTVYQAPYSPQRHGRLPNLDRGEPPAVVQARGVQVEIWISGGLLFATAKDGNGTP